MGRFLIIIISDVIVILWGIYRENGEGRVRRVRSKGGKDIGKDNK